DMDAITEAGKGTVVYGVERDGKRRDFVIHPGADFPWVAFAVNVLVALGYLLIGPLALVKRPGYLRARLLFLFTAAVAAELALPEIRDSISLILPLSLLINGFQMGSHLHLASVLPERQHWVRRRPWAIPLFYVLGLGSFGLVGAAFLAERYGWVPPPRISGSALIDWLNWLVIPAW